MIPEYKRSEMNSRLSMSITGKICIAIFASNLVGMVSYLALSVWILRETNSYVLSSALFGCQWILPLVWPTGIARLTEKVNAGMVAARSEWTSALLSVILIFTAESKLVPLVLILVVIRGFCDSLTRSSASLVVKFKETERNKVERDISRIEFWRIVGTSAAGMLFGLLGEQSSVKTFLICSSLVYVLTGILLWNVRNTVTMSPIGNELELDGLHVLVKALRAQRIASGWLWQLGIVAAFQGLHNAIRIAYPDQRLGQGVDGVGIVSTVSTLGVLCGGWVASRNKAINILKLFPEWTLVAIVGLLGSLAVFIPVALPSYAVYFTFMVLFEATFMVFNLNVVTNTEQHYAPVLFGFRTTLLGASTLLGLAITSVFLLMFSVTWSTLAMTVLLSAFSILLSYQYRIRRQE